MELPKPIFAKLAAMFAGCTSALALATLSGCVALDGFVTKTDEPPTGQVATIGAFWQKQVAFAPDLVHNGEPTPGLVGRLYLFGQDVKFPLAADGKVTVMMFATHSPTKLAAPGTYPPDEPLEKWEFDPATLKRLLQKDRLGWGYTLVMPMGNYRPDIIDVKIRVCYQPPKSLPLYTECRIALEHPTGK